MKLVVFGLSISSSWGNGQATTWRALARGLAEAGHELVFFERDAPYYAQHRDLEALPSGRLHLYVDWEGVRALAEQELADAGAALVTSYCPDGAAASELVLAAPVTTRAFYDMDAPVTLSQLRAGRAVPYLPARGLGDFDVVLSFTGGGALEALQARLGARRAVPLYGCVDEAVHAGVADDPRFAADLSYLGTYAEDRQAALASLLLAPARARPDQAFLVAGPLYPTEVAWPANVRRLEHVAPPEHGAFYGSSRLTLNLTRGPMKAMGYCPQGRLFEAATCGATIVTDEWEGLDAFFAPGTEVLVARGPADVAAYLEAPAEALAAVGRAARSRTLAAHTGTHRARELVDILEGAARSHG